MVNITIINRAGDARTIDVASGQYVMEIIRDSGFDEMPAMCAEIVRAQRATPISEAQRTYRLSARMKKTCSTAQTFERNAPALPVKLRSRT
jgi:ferredoxin